MYAQLFLALNVERINNIWKTYKESVPTNVAMIVVSALANYFKTGLVLANSI